MTLAVPCFLFANKTPERASFYIGYNFIVYTTSYIFATAIHFYTTLTSFFIKHHIVNTYDYISERVYKVIKHRQDHKTMVVALSDDRDRMDTYL